MVGVGARWCVQSAGRAERYRRCRHGSTRRPAERPEPLPAGFACSPGQPVGLERLGLPLQIRHQLQPKAGGVAAAAGGGQVSSRRRPRQQESGGSRRARPGGRWHTRREAQISPCFKRGRPWQGSSRCAHAPSKRTGQRTSCTCLGVCRGELPRDALHQPGIPPPQVAAGRLIHRQLLILELQTRRAGQGGVGWQKEGPAGLASSALDGGAGHREAGGFTHTHTPRTHTHTHTHTHLAAQDQEAAHSCQDEAGLGHASIAGVHARQVTPAARVQGEAGQVG